MDRSLVALLTKVYNFDRCVTGAEPDQLLPDSVHVCSTHRWLRLQRQQLGHSARWQEGLSDERIIHAQMLSNKEG